MATSSHPTVSDRVSRNALSTSQTSSPRHPSTQLTPQSGRPNHADHSCLASVLELELPAACLGASLLAAHSLRTLTSNGHNPLHPPPPRYPARFGHSCGNYAAATARVHRTTAILLARWWCFGWRRCCSRRARGVAGTRTNVRARFKPSGRQEPHLWRHRWLKMGGQLPRMLLVKMQARMWLLKCWLPLRWRQ